MNNIFRELPPEVKLRIDEEALDITTTLTYLCLSCNTAKEIIELFREAYLELLQSTEADKWFTNESHLKDLDRMQESYEKEIKELNEVIQRKAQQ